MSALIKSAIVAAAVLAGGAVLPASAAGIAVPDKSAMTAGTGSSLKEPVHWGRRGYRRSGFYFYVGPRYYRPYYRHYRPYYYGGYGYRPYYHYRPHRFVHRHWW